MCRRATLQHLRGRRGLSARRRIPLPKDRLRRRSSKPLMVCSPCRNRNMSCRLRPGPGVAYARGGLPEIRYGRSALTAPRRPDRASNDVPGRCGHRCYGARGSSRTIRPGIPTTVMPGGTSSITTELAPMRALAPTDDGTEDFGPGADQHAAVQRRVALAGRPARAAQGDAMIQA